MTLRSLKLKKSKLRREAQNSFYSFFCQAWNIIWPEIPFKNGWHYKVLCDRFQLEAERIHRREPKTKDIIVNVPPRTAKSSLIVIALNAWVWLNYSSQKFLTSSYADSLSISHSQRTKWLIATDWYKSLQNEDSIFKILYDADAKSDFENNKGGFRKATSVGGAGTGEGGDWTIVDDPTSIKEGQSETIRKTANDWYDGTWWTRLNDKEIGIRIIVMQRGHEDDLTGHLLEIDPDKYDLYCFPAIETESEISPSTCKKFYIDGLLNEKLLPRKVLIDAKKALGSYMYAAQYSQTPSPEEGGLFKKYYWSFWQYKGMNLRPHETRLPDGSIHIHPLIELPEEFDTIIGSMDLAFKGKLDSDRVCMDKWGLKKVRKFLMKQKCDTMTYVKTRKEVRRFDIDNPDCDSILIEDKANGPAVMNDLEELIPNINPVEPSGTKTARATTPDASGSLSMVAQCEAGNIVLPHPSIFPWVLDTIEEYAGFPFKKRDDKVDTGTQAVNFLTIRGDMGIFGEDEEDKKTEEEIDEALDKEIGISA